MRPASRSPQPWRDCWNEYARGAGSPTAIGGVVATGLLLGATPTVGPDIPSWTIWAGVAWGTAMTIAPTASALFFKSEHEHLNQERRVQRFLSGAAVDPPPHTERPRSYRLGLVFPALATLATAALLTAASGTPAHAGPQPTAVPAPAAASATLAR